MAEATPELLYQATAFNELYKSPKLRPKLLNLLKEYNPEMRIPEIDTAADVDTRLKPVLERAEKAEQRVASLESKLAKDAETDELVTSGVVAREDLPEVEKVMVDKGITNRKTAAEHVKMSKQVARPRSAGPTPISLPDPKEWMANPTKKAREEAYKVIHEFGH